MVDGSTRRLPSWMVDNGEKKKSPTLPNKTKTKTKTKKLTPKVAVKKKKIKPKTPITEDDDLTVEDLVSIAQEYVKADDEEAKQILKRKCGDSCVNLSSQESLINGNDPAQEMLHLLLGSLLKKPLAEEAEIDMYDFGKQTETQSDDVREEAEPGIILTKKKTSLKNKVSSLLN